MIKREKYLKQLVNARNNGFPKVITGIRRCGKSFLLKEIFRSYLLSDGVSPDAIIAIDLDDDKNIKYRDPLELGSYVREQCAGKKMCYVFLDEIQMVYDIVNPNLTDGKNIDLYVTGSNSQMLSSDIVTAFRDKATNIQLYPLSFEEFNEYIGGSPAENIYEYMQHGGMPLAVQKSREDKRTYLKSLFETTYFKDILERNNLKKSEAMDELCNILSASTGELLNARKISNTYNSVRHDSISKMHLYYRKQGDTILKVEKKSAQRGSITFATPGCGTQD